MPFIGVQPATVPLTSSDITDGIISTAKIADDAVGNTKLDLTAYYAFTGTITGTPDNTPSFLATRGSSDQSISASTWTKVQFNSEIFDTDNMYDPSTNYRFTPTVAGKYYIFVNLYTSTPNTHIYVSLYFNGNSNLPVMAVDGSQGGGAYIGNVLVFDGVDDYVEAYTYQGGSTGSVEDLSQASIFGGYKIIGA